MPITALVVAAVAVVEEVHGLRDAVREAIFRAAGGVADLVVHYAVPAFQHIEDARLELAVILFLGLAVGRGAKSSPVRPRCCRPLRFTLR